MAFRSFAMILRDIEPDATSSGNGACIVTACLGMMLRHGRQQPGLGSAGSDFAIFQLEAFYANKSCYFLSARFSQPDFVQRTPSTILSGWNFRLLPPRLRRLPKHYGGSY